MRKALVLLGILGFLSQPIMAQAMGYQSGSMMQTGGAAGACGCPATQTGFAVPVMTQPCPVQPACPAQPACPSMCPTAPTCPTGGAATIIPICPCEPTGGAATVTSPVVQEIQTRRENRMERRENRKENREARREKRQERRQERRAARPAQVRGYW